MLRHLTLLLGALFLLAACTSGRNLGRNPELSLEQLIQRANTALAQKDYPQAAGWYEAATNRDPHNLALQLRHGEVLQAARLWPGAAEAYRSAINSVRPQSQPDFHQLHLQLGLLLALKLNRIAEAEDQRDQIPPSEQVDRLDLSAAIFIGKGKPHDALRLLHRAAKQVKHADDAARIDFHSAIAYHALGEDKNTYKALFQAVNTNAHLGQGKQIEDFWYSLENRNAPLPPP